MRCFCCLLLCGMICTSHEREDLNPDKYGIVFRMTKKGLTQAFRKYFTSHYIKLKNKYNITIPPIENVNETVDGVNYFIESLHLKDNMDQDNFKASVDIENSTQCLKISITDSLAVLQGSVQCRNVQQRDHIQNCNITLKMPWYFKIHIGRNKQGQISAEMCNKNGDSCSIPFSDMVIDYTDCDHQRDSLHVCEWGTSEFKNAFINHRLKKTLQRFDVCGHLTFFINNFMSKELENVVHLFPNVGDGNVDFYKVNLSMTQDPTYTTSYIDTYHNGDLYWYSTLEHYVTDAVNFTRGHNDSKMVYLWVSKNEIQSILHGIQTHGRIHFNVTADNIPGHGLNTTCKIGVCVGRLVPSLAKLYKDCFMDLDIYSLETPTLLFDKNLAVVNGEVVMFANIRDPNKHLSTRIAKLDVSVTLRFKVSMKNARLQGEVVAFDPFIKSIVADPAVTGFDSQTVNFILRGAVVVRVEPELNKLGKIGFNLPVSKAELCNTTVQLIKDAIVIGTDIEQERNETDY